jgi:hypothetical protein
MILVDSVLDLRRGALLHSRLLSLAFWHLHGVKLVVFVSRPVCFFFK